jgi:hypothetical protein
MKKNLCVLLLLLLLPALPALAATPKLVVEAPDFNFGQVFAGEKVEHTFTFLNQGDAPLEIEQVRSSCGCTAALVSARSIPPGESGEIRTTFDSSRFRGNVLKTVTLYSNDPAQKTAQFQLRGIVKQELVPSPERISLGTLTSGTSTAVRLTLTNQGTRHLSQITAQATHPDLKVSLGATRLGPGESTVATVTATPGTSTTTLNSYVLVRDIAAGVAEIRIPVSGVVQTVPVPAQ